MQSSSLLIIAFFYLMVLGGGFFFIFHKVSVAQYLYLSPFLFLLPRFSFDLIYVIGLIGIFLLDLLYSQKPPRIKLYYTIFFTILLIAGIRSYFMGIRGNNAHVFFVNLCLMPITLFTIVSNSIITDTESRKIITLHVYTATFLAIIGIALSILNPTERIGSTWAEAMTINGYYIIGFFLGLGLLDKEKGLHKSIISVMVIVILFGMIFTYTRIILVGVAFGLFLMCFRKPRLFRYMFLLIFIFPFVLPEEMIVRIKSTQQKDLSMLIRFLVWYYSAKIIWENPIWGLGFDSFHTVYKGLMSIKTLRAIHSHNIYLRVLLEMGLVGFVGYMGVIISTLKRGYKTFRKVKGLTLEYMIWVSLIVELVMCITDVFISQIAVSFIFWLLLALMYNKSLYSSPIKELETPEMPLVS
jgi:O-antigen ligase